jgi:hypothetical protein
MASSRWRNTRGATAVRVAGRLAQDKIVRRRAVTYDDVPSGVDAITPAWLTAVLCSEHPGAEVIAFDVVWSSSGTHQRHRLEITYNDAGQGCGLPPALFIKSLPTLVTRMIGGYNGTARVEGRFYSDVRPELTIEAPLGYHSAFDPKSLACVNIIEDIVATKRASFCDHSTLVTQAMAEDMVDLLAQLHAHHYNDPRLDTELRWLADYPTWFRVGSQKMRTEHYTTKALERAASVIPRTVLDRRAELWPAIVDTVHVHERGPRSFLHSDVHIGNWYRTDEGAMGLCDWQCPSKGHWSRDVAYAISTALRSEDRREWERDLVDRYLERLQELAGVRVPASEAWDHYRQQMLHALWMWTITLCHSPFLPNMQPDDTSMEMISRITTAMADLDSLDVTPVPA